MATGTRVRKALGVLLGLLLCAAPASAQLLGSGNIAVNGATVSVPTAGVPSVSIQVSGTWSGTLSFFSAPTGGACTNALQVSNSATGGTATTTTANGVWTVPNGGYLTVCVTATAWSSGTAGVNITQGFGGAGGGGGGGGGGGAVTVADGADVVAGTTTDAAVGDATGTMNAHLRQIAKTLGAGFSLTGTKTNNNAVPGATNVGTLGCVANASNPSWTETFQVGCSVDLSGSMRVNVTNANANGPALPASASPVVASLPGLHQQNNVSLTTNASISVIAAVTSNYLYIVSCQASGATTTGTLVLLQDGSGGTTLATIPVPAAAASSVAGAIVVFPVWLKVPIGDALFAANNTSTTTTLSCQGFSSTINY